MRHCRSWKRKRTLTVHCLSVALSFVKGRVGLTEPPLPLLSPTRSPIWGDRDGDRVFWQRKPICHPGNGRGGRDIIQWRQSTGLSITPPPASKDGWEERVYWNKIWQQEVKQWVRMRLRLFSFYCQPIVNSDAQVHVEDCMSYMWSCCC